MLKYCIDKKRTLFFSLLIYYIAVYKSHGET